MNIIKKLQVLIMIIMFSAGCAYAITPDHKKDLDQNLEFTDLSKPIMVSQKNPIITLKLKSNPTTGFSWFLISYDDKFLEPLSSKYFLPEKMIPGAGGYEIWKFKVKPAAQAVPQVGHLVMQYLRPWSLESANRTQINLVFVRD